MTGCWHVWRKRRVRRVHTGSENGIDYFALYPPQCLSCFLDKDAS